MDYRLVEYVYSLPAVYRVNQGWTKWMLRKVMDGRLPDDVTWRRGKLGFATPEQRWLAVGKDWIRAYFKQQKPASLRYLKPEAIASLQRAGWRLAHDQS
ncbi:MAG: asparagine synthase-related protein [Chloroflexi bacterium]|nr:asparagine synthase-related protein [Chloroflexota bacterium]